VTVISPAAPGREGERMARFTGVLGLLTMLALAYLFSTDRRAIKLKTVAWGLALQITFAFLVFYSTFGQQLFIRAGDAVSKMLGYAYAGSEFVFGELGKRNSSIGFIFAFQVLPTIIFIAALFALLYYLGVMQVIIRGAAWVMQRVMGASGAESLNVAASIFMGQTEAPLTIRPFIPDLTKSELMTIMTSGMAHVSGGMMAAYIAFGVEARHLLTAVIMTAPGTILMAKMLVPETEQPKTMGTVHMENVERDLNFLAAIARGTTEGLGMAINVGAMLIAFLALIALTNGIMGGIHDWLGGHGVLWFPSSLQQIFGWAFAPLAWIIGVPWRDCVQIGNLLGTRMVVNELVAFSYLGPMKGTLDPRSFTIATFALCGFANFSSIGMQIGGIGALAPNQKSQLAKFGIRAMLAGTMANLMSASIVGMFLK
jgi:CNT family concentrative nucleoside transporter